MAPINQALRMLDPRSDSKRLRFHGQPQLIQPAVSVPGAVADGQKHGIRFDDASVNALGCLLILDSADLSIPKGQPRDLAAEAYFAAQFDQLLPGTDQYLPQHICAYVRLLSGQDAFRGSALVQSLQHRLNVGAVQAAGQFAVTERACPAFPKKNVAFLVQNGLALQFFYVPDALFHGLTPLHQDRLCTPAGQRQRAEKSGWPSPYDHGARSTVPWRKIQLHYAFGGLGRRNHRYLIGAKLCCKGRFHFCIGKFRVHCQGKMHVALVPRVHASLLQPDGTKLLFGDSKLAGAEAAKRLFVRLRVQRQLELMNPKQAFTPQDR